MTINKETELKLQKLRGESRKFPNSDKQIMQNLVDELFEEGTYYITPDMQESGKTPMYMVNHYGVYWFNWDNIADCEWCGKDIRDIEKGPPNTKSIYVKRLGIDGGQLICFDCESEMKKRS